MKILVIHFSKFGHTKQIAEAIAEGLMAIGPVQVCDIDQVDDSELQDANLVVLGSPTHNMNLPKALRPILDSLPRRVVRDTSVAAFDTSYKMNGLLARFTAAPRLDRKLRKLGGKRIVPSVSFFVEEREGPLYEGEIERAREWGALIGQRLSESKIKQITQI